MMLLTVVGPTSDTVMRPPNPWNTAATTHNSIIVTTITTTIITTITITITIITIVTTIITITITIIITTIITITIVTIITTITITTTIIIISEWHAHYVSIAVSTVFRDEGRSCACR